VPESATSEGQRLFDNQVSPTARLVFYGLLAIVLMATDFKSDYVGKMRYTASLIAAPFYAALEWPFAAGKSLQETARYHQTLLDENEQFRQEQLKTSGQLQEMDSIRLEISRLRSLLGASSSLRVDFQFAELMRVDLDPFSHRVLINSGTKEGVFAGQPVIDSGGIVGQVETVLPGMSYVRLISDPSHALPVQIARTGQRCIIYGIGDTELLILRNLPFNIDLQPGDRIITSGLGERFPSGYPVAEVMSVERRPGQTFALGYARPLAALDRGREVLLLKLESTESGETAAPADDETSMDEAE
jgi:rod shape-determining protein MreC